MPAWSHNIHYHHILLQAIPPNCRRALDVGCGRGLLARELAHHSPEVVAIDADAIPSAAPGNPPTPPCSRAKPDRSAPEHRSRSPPAPMPRHSPGNEPPRDRFPPRATASPASDDGTQAASQSGTPTPETPEVPAAARSAERSATKPPAERRPPAAPHTPAPARARAAAKPRTRQRPRTEPAAPASPHRRRSLAYTERENFKLFGGFLCASGVFFCNRICRVTRARNACKEGNFAIPLGEARNSGAKIPWKKGLSRR